MEITFKFNFDEKESEFLKNLNIHDGNIFSEYKDTFIFKIEKETEDLFIVENLYEKGLFQLDFEYELFYPTMIGEMVIKHVKGL
jgi:predicted transcriptional regulator YheO